ncbi:MAG: hypothetical protein JXA08_00350 [Methanomicrobiaceae archaeon]|nr:hypothetical protein [Methanomicrobiaceae archaeon]
MMKKTGWIAGIFVLALVCMAGTAAAQEDNGTYSEGTVISDDVPPYTGPIGPGSPLYGLKIAFEDLDVSFTANETEYVTKLLRNNRERLSEVRSELQRNNTDAADRALALYLQKTNMTRQRLQTSADSTADGLLHAQEMVLKHQLVLENLIDTHPGNTGLMRAYDNSLALEQKFQEKTQTRFDRVTNQNRLTLVKAVRLEVRQQQNTENAETQAVRGQETQEGQQKTGNAGSDSTEQQSGNAGIDSTEQKKVTETPTSKNPTAVRKAGNAPSVSGNDG